MTRLEQAASWASIVHGPLTTTQRVVLFEHYVRASEGKPWSPAYDALTVGRRARTIRSLQSLGLLHPVTGNPTMDGARYARRLR